MSMKTLLEIDHNMLHDIVQRPEAFAKLLRVALGSGPASDYKDDLWDFGVRVASMKHSSSPWLTQELAPLNRGLEDAARRAESLSNDDAFKILGRRIYDRCMKSVKYATAMAASAVDSRNSLIEEVNALSALDPSKANDGDGNGQ